MKKLCVIGSLNVDLTIRVPRFHVPGETITGEDFKTYAGGKGGNQAVASAKLGADTLMAACLGDDQNAQFYRSVLAESGVDARGVGADASVPSGVALIEVDPSGENRIALVPGANASMTPARVDAVWPFLADRDIFLFQLEIPLETIEYAARRLHEAGKTVLLDPAPARPLPDALLACADFITPNETELSLLSGMPADTPDQAVAAARSLIQRGARAVLAKRGRHGAMLITAGEVIAIPGFTVKAVDTTAAGDSFNAGFAVALAQDLPLPQAVRFANAVGALSTTAHGAQGAMPGMDAARALIEEQTGII